MAYDVANLRFLMTENTINELSVLAYSCDHADTQIVLAKLGSFLAKDETELQDFARNCMRYISAVKAHGKEYIEQIKQRTIARLNDAPLWTLAYHREDSTVSIMLAGEASSVPVFCAADRESAEIYVTHVLNMRLHE